ncbi:MAG: dihydropteroate synthase [Anaerolineae bacterium]|nr:dihydropteroate synthase [Anaerolineae bacterium]
MKTTVSSATKTVIIGDDQPTVIIGERINPTGKKKLAAALLAGDLEMVRQEAIQQVAAGADILDVNVGVAGVDEVALLPEAVKIVMEAVDVPLCIDSANPEALEAALEVYQGKPIVNSVSGEEASLQRILPLVKKYNTVVIGLCMDDDGIPQNDPEKRVAIARKIVARAEALGIPREDILIDCLALTLGANDQAGLVTLQAMRQVKAELGVNLTLGASNISFGLPERELLNTVFLSICLAAGLNCPIVDAAKMRPAILAADLALGRDSYGRRYIRAYRARLKAAASAP